MSVMARIAFVGLAAAAALALGTALAQRASGDAPPLAPAGLGADRGIVRIACFDGKRNVRRRTRGLLAATRADLPHDVVVSTAHGLPDDPAAIIDQCRILAAPGGTYGIAGVWRPADAGSDAADDWAVLRTDRRIEGTVARLAVRVLTSDTLRGLTADEAPVRLMLSAPSADLAGCTFKPAPVEREIAAGVFTHSCRSWAGLSGSPIVIDAEAPPVVVALNLGHRMKPFGSDGPLFVGVGRAIDAEIAAAIARAAGQAELTERAKLAAEGAAR